MNVNLGCGQFPHIGWLNCDRYDFDGVDLVVNITELPWENDSVDRVYMGHVLEHLTYDDELPRALEEVRRVLRRDADGGELMVVGPDLDRARLTAPEWAEAIWPGAHHDAPGAKHQWPSTLPDTRAALRNAGFQHEVLNIEDVPLSWPVTSWATWQLAVRGWKA